MANQDRIGKVYKREIWSRYARIPIRKTAASVARRIAGYKPVVARSPRFPRP
jgi:hypothetical protein